jgi:hypothetical protein
VGIIGESCAAAPEAAYIFGCRRTFLVNTCYFFILKFLLALNCVNKHTTVNVRLDLYHDVSILLFWYFV